MARGPVCTTLNRDCRCSSTEGISPGGGGEGNVGGGGEGGSVCGRGEGRGWGGKRRDSTWEERGLKEEGIQGGDR